MYRPPKQCPSFLDEISELLSIIITTNYDIIIVGDLNLHMDNVTDSKAQDFVKLLSSMDFIQHIGCPAHKLGHILDLVITRGLTMNETSVADLPLSDHYRIFFSALVSMKRHNWEHLVKKRYLT